MNLKEIFEKQFELNQETLSKKCNLSYDRIVNLNTHYIATDLRPKWIENYRKAFSSEFAEYIKGKSENRTCIEKINNARMELVDMLHFLVSLSQLNDLSCELCYDAIAGSMMNERENSNEKILISMFLNLDELQSSLDWKWWSNGGSYKKEKAQKAIINLWNNWVKLCWYEFVSMQEIEEIYFKKNKINSDRINNGYNSDTKIPHEDEIQVFTNNNFCRRTN